MNSPDLTCTKCGATASFVKINGVTCNPPGWSFVTLQGLPIINGQLCPTCAPAVRAYIETPPAPTISAEAKAQLSPVIDTPMTVTVRTVLDSAAIAKAVGEAQL